ncbi:MAG: hypothetical protein OEN01_13780, partial [Candidatus Krumholzibacteria bacterium]|nr:hypothetical protein [Candidatus Krumholzibacteria bacterium]
QTRQVARQTTDRVEWYHDRDGIYLLWGNHIKSGFDGGARDITDITPTILYLLGLPLAGDFDGAVMNDVIRSEILTTKPRYYIADYGQQAPEKHYTSEELESLEEKLKTLGYLR